MDLPQTKQSPRITPESFNWLFDGSNDGIGKSSLLCSVPDLLIIDPDYSCKALPGYIINIENWRQALDFLKTIQKEFPKKYSGLGIDNLNIFHDLLFEDFVKREGHPADKNDMGKTWSKLTKEYIYWIRDLRRASSDKLFLATSHTNMVEVKIKNVPFSRYVPAIPGGGPRGAYRQTMETFDIIGFMNKETGKTISPPKDARADLSTIPISEGKEELVIHFYGSQYYEAKDNSHMLPERVTLSNDWTQDWKLILDAFGKEK
jgi:hypothetical protein